MTMSFIRSRFFISFNISFVENPTEDRELSVFFIFSDGKELSVKDVK